MTEKGTNKVLAFVFNVLESLSTLVPSAVLFLSKFRHWKRPSWASFYTLHNCTQGRSVKQMQNFSWLDWDKVSPDSLQVRHAFHGCNRPQLLNLQQKFTITPYNSLIVYLSIAGWLSAKLKIKHTTRFGPSFWLQLKKQSSSSSEPAWAVQQAQHKVMRAFYIANSYPHSMSVMVHVVSRYPSICQDTMRSLTSSKLHCQATHLWDPQNLCFVVSVVPNIGLYRSHLSEQGFFQMRPDIWM